MKKIKKQKRFQFAHDTQTPQGEDELQISRFISEGNPTAEKSEAQDHVSGEKLVNRKKP